MSTLTPGRHVDEAAARPGGGVERRELVVIGRDDLAEVLLDQLRVLPEGGVHVAEQDALSFEILPVLVVDDLALVLGGHAGQVLALRFRDPELLVGGLDRFGQLVPCADLLLDGLDVVVDVVEVDAGHVAAPGRHGPALEVAEGLEPAVGHPLGLALHPGHLPDALLGEALLRLVDVVVLDVAPAQLVAAEIQFCSCHASPLCWSTGDFSYVDSNNPDELPGKLIGQPPARRVAGAAGGRPSPVDQAEAAGPLGRSGPPGPAGPGGPPPPGVRPPPPTLPVLIQPVGHARIGDPRDERPAAWRRGG